MSYLKNNTIAIDQLLNTLLLGDPDETLSSRAYRAERDGKILGEMFRPVIDTLFFFEQQHCYNSHLSEKYRRQLASEFQKDENA